MNAQAVAEFLQGQALLLAPPPNLLPDCSGNFFAPNSC